MFRYLYAYCALRMFQNVVPVGRSAGRFALNRHNTFYDVLCFYNWWRRKKVNYHFFWFYWFIFISSLFVCRKTNWYPVNSDFCVNFDLSSFINIENVRIIEMDQLVKPSSIQQPPVMSQTKTMILQSTGNEFHYVSPPHLLAEVKGTQIADVWRARNAIERHNTHQCNFFFAATPAAAAIIEKETEFAVNADTLPPPAPPIVTITNSGKIQHDQPFVLTSRPSVSSNNTQAAEVYGCLRYKDNVLYITEHSIEIGRNSSTSTVHFHVGKNVFVSRKHLQLLHDRNTSDFYLMCLSKNGVFVDDIFQRKSSEPLKLPKWSVTHPFAVWWNISNVLYVCLFFLLTPLVRRSGSRAPIFG